MNCNATGTTSLLPAAGGLDPERGVHLDYFVKPDGFTRPILPLDRPGLVWLEGLMIVRDPQGRDRMVARYTRVDKAKSAEERGIAFV